jgi:hypothetical protein
MKLKKTPVDAEPETAAENTVEDDLIFERVPTLETDKKEPRGAGGEATSNGSLRRPAAAPPSPRKCVFTKAQVLKMKRYDADTDLLAVLLENNKVYALDDVRRALDEYKTRKAV